MTGTTAGVATVVFTDVEGSTTLVRRLGPDYEPLLDRHFRLLRAALVDDGGGRFVNTDGDGMLVLFDDPAAAVTACRAAQLALLRERFHADHGLRVRMGIHTGEVRPTAAGDDVTGLGVHQAARITAAGHGGQIVCSAVVAAAAPPDLEVRDLGRFRVRDFDEPERLFEVAVPGADASPALRVRPAEAHNLPPRRTSFVGRSSELVEVTKLMEETRLLTLTGPGGAGKTRLAEELVRRQAEVRPDGATFVELAGVDDGALVAARLTETLGVRAEPGRPLLETLAAALAGRDALIVLDNCEHVRAAAAEAADAVLDQAPSVTLVATSRQPLGVRGEVVVPVEALEVPTPATPVEALATVDSVRLLVERAAAAGARLQIDDATAPAVIRLCRRLDGLPLAIELAAARLRSLSVATLAERIDRMAAGLSDGGTGRQSTVRALVDWSLQLLPADARLLFARLGTFRCAFDLDAAEAVGAAEPLAAHQVLGLLDQLVAHSLVAFDPAGAGRYRLLAVVRDVAEAELAASGDEEHALRRHLLHHATVVERDTARLVGPDAAEAGRTLEAHLDDLRAALARAATRPADRDVAVETALRLVRFWDRAGLALEGMSVLESFLDEDDEATAPRLLYGIGALRRPIDPPAARALLERAVAGLEHAEDDVMLANALVSAGLAAVDVGDGERGAAALRRALDLSRSLGDDGGVARALVSLATLHNRSGGYAEARAVADEALVVAARTSDALLTASATSLLGQIAFNVGDLDEAERRGREALAVAEDLDDRAARASRLGDLGNVAHRRGDVVTAEARFTEAVAVAAEIGDRRALSRWSANLGVVAVTRGDFAGAAEWYERGLEAARSIDDWATTALAAGNLGQVRAMAGDHEAAEALFSEALAIARRTGDRGRVAASLGNLGNLALVTGRPADAEPFLREALEIAEATGNVRGQAVYAQYLGQAALDQADPAGAAEWLRTAAERSRACGDVRWEVMTQRTLARALAATDDLDGAHDALIAANDLVERIPDPTQLAACRAAMAHLHAVRGDVASARTSAREALDHVDRAADKANVLLEVAAAVGGGFAVELAAAVATARGTAGGVEQPLAPALDRALAAARADLGDDDYAARWAAGASRTVPQAIEVARAQLD